MLILHEFPAVSWHIAQNLMMRIALESLLLYFWPVENAHRHNRPRRPSEMLFMQIWVDADACPGEIKEMLYRAAKRCEILVTLVANQVLAPPKSSYISTILVPDGANVADRQIVELASPGDLVITADIPLAADVVAKGARALNPRGELYTDANVGERLAMRNLLDDMRGGGRTMRGPSPITAKDRQAFANQLDRWMTTAKPRQR